jgi:hypothetical protein
MTPEPTVAMVAADKGDIGGSIATRSIVSAVFTGDIRPGCTTRSHSLGDTVGHTFGRHRGGRDLDVARNDASPSDP